MVLNFNKLITEKMKLLHSQLRFAIVRNFLTNWYKPVNKFYLEIYNFMIL
jgi:hypothetical protein